MKRRSNERGGGEEEERDAEILITTKHYLLGVFGFSDVIFRERGRRRGNRERRN